jgi:serine/threonine protein kinase
VVRVLDFGLVKELGTDSSSTTTAALTGTPLYLSPEAITAPEKVDGRSDGCDRPDDWSDERAASWWQLHRAEADAAKPKLSVASRLPGPMPVDLEERA